MNWGRIWASLRQARIPIIAELRSASWPNWREAFKELFVILFFSLMPLWLGLLIVKLLTITDSTSGFIAKFASSSDLGILSASLLGPMLYMMFREDNDATGNRIIPGFPSGLWIIMVTMACCIVATVIYSFTYLSGDQRIDAEPVTKHKMLTNYRYMLESAGVLLNGELQPKDLRQRWIIDAVQLFWDRQIFDGALPASASRTALEESLIDHEIYKLLRCDKKQCEGFARAAFGEFSLGQAADRLAQIAGLKSKGLIAA
jgi:hypothetical protein